MTSSISMAGSNDKENTRLIELYDRYVTDTATVEELREFWSLVKAMPDDHPLHQHVFNQFNKIAADAATAIDWSKATAKIFGGTNVYPGPVHRVHFLKRTWWKYAAAILMLFGIGTLVYIHHSTEKASVTQTNPVPVQNDVAPGGNRATLTLADGSEIILDSANTGIIAKEGRTSVRKTGDGSVVYDGLRTGNGTETVLTNMLSTPRGGQYQLTLPDGSRVWLNAESSITYPTAFTGHDRSVSITGEAYFEVAKDKSKPFRVQAGEQTIEVLGTHFNVNAYADENVIATTLLEVAVRLSTNVRTPEPPGKSVHTSLTLRPGQQGQYNPRSGGLALAATADIEAVMAWKNGAFYFRSEDLGTIMKQLARWYDLEVEYAGEPPLRTFSGEIERSLTLNQVLSVLTQTRIKYRIQGKKITILP